MEQIILTENQIFWLKLLVKGYGFDASKKEFNGKKLKEMEQLIEIGFVKRAKNYTGDKVGCFCIADNKKDDAKKVLAYYA